MTWDPRDLITWLWLDSEELRLLEQEHPAETTIIKRMGG